MLPVRFRTLTSRQLPEVENCDEIQGLMSGLVISLFGAGASKGGAGQSAHPWARGFMSQMMTTVFRAQRKRMRKEMVQIKHAAVTAEEKWQGGSRSRAVLRVC